MVRVKSFPDNCWPNSQTQTSPDEVFTLKQTVNLNELKARTEVELSRRWYDVGGVNYSEYTSALFSQLGVKKFL